MALAQQAEQSAQQAEQVQQAEQSTPQPEPTQTELAPYSPSIPGVRYPTDVRFANGMRLIAYDVEPDLVDLSNGDRRLRLHLFWQGDASGPANAIDDEDVKWWAAKEFDVFAHLIEGNTVVQRANHLLGGRQRLDRGDYSEDIHEFTVPRDVSLGKAYFEVDCTITLAPIFL